MEKVFPKNGLSSGVVGVSRSKSFFLLAVLIFFYGLNYMDRSVLSIVGDSLRMDLSLTDGQLGLLHSALLIMLIFLLIPGAALGDIVGRKPLLATAAGIWTGAMALVATATGFGQLLAGRCLASINEGTAGAGGVSWLANYFPAEKRGKVLGFYQMAVPLGMSLGLFLGGVILAITGSWRLSFYCFLIPGVFCVFAIPKLPDRQVISTAHYFGAFGKLLKIKTLILCGIGAGFFCICKFAYQAWYPLLLLRSYPELSPVKAGLIAGVFLLAGALGPIIGGTLSDKWNRTSPSGRCYALAVCLAAIVLVKSALYFCTGKIGLVGLCGIGIVDGIITMTPMPIYFAICQDVAPDNLRGTATGIMGALVYLTGGAWGPLLIGFLSDYFNGGAGGLRCAELVLLVFPALAILVYLLCSIPYRKENLARRVDQAGAAGL